MNPATHPGRNVTPYEMIGGEHQVRALIDKFYDLMNSVPEYYVIRKLHAPDLSGAREKLYRFLTGWLGGPPLYAEKHGNPMLRARHLPFAIGIAGRDAWIHCMQSAADAEIADEKLREWLIAQLFKTADWMRNQAD